MYDIKDFVKAPNEKILKYNKGMKFDCIVSNAPYDNGLHEKFESKYFELCKGEIVWVSPLSFLLGKKQNKRITLELDKYKTDIEQINGNEYFDAAIGGTMGIVFCDMTGRSSITFDGKKYNKTDGISTYSNDDLLVSIKHKIGCNNLSDSIHNHIVKEPNTNKFSSCKIEQNPQDNWWCIRMSPFAGDNHRGNKGADFYATVTKKYINELPITYKEAQSKTYKFNNGVIKNYMDYYIHFNTYSEAKHCLDYLISDFARICIYFIKTTIELSSGELKYVPWQDFTQEWNDEKLFKKYGITKEEIQHIYDILPNYYNIERIDLDTYKLNSITFDGKQYSKCDEIRSYSNDELLVNFYNIVSPLYKNTNLEQHLKTMSTSRYTKYNTKNQNINNYILRFDRSAGNKEKGDDFYTLLHKGNISKCIGTYKDLSKQTYIYGNKLYNFVEFYFDLITKHNCENFRNYLMCDFARTCLYLIKNTTDLMRGELKYIPWFDFSDPVFSKSPSEIDDYLFAKYIPEVDEETGITRDEIRKHIEELLPDYYNIRK